MRTTMNNVTPGTKVRLGYRSHEWDATFKEFRVGRMRFDTLAAVKDALEVTTNKQLDALGAVLAFFTDADDEMEWSAYLFNGRWSVGTSADALRFVDDVAPPISAWAFYQR